MVLVGHWFSGTILWVPVTFGLFVFAFSSAYFTGKIYGVEINRQEFWSKKFERLGVRFWLILIFLSVVVTVSGKSILHWHSVLHFLGLSGALNWSHTANQSGLGAGLWFFTLLLIFYGAYPFIAKLSQPRLIGALFAIGATALAVALEDNVKVGHELWLTSLGFILGVVYALHEMRANSRKLGFAILAACALLVALNTPLLGAKQFNTVLIMLISVSICVWLASRPGMKSPVFRQIAKLDKYLLEIFLIHTYLFMRPTGNTWIDLLLSVGVIMVASVALNVIETRISRHLFGATPLNQAERTQTIGATDTVR